MIKLAATDLKYLLAQVNIGNDYSQLVSPLDPNGVREVSGSNNNLVGGFDVDGHWIGNNLNPDWGQADTDFLRLFATDHPTKTAYGITYDPVVKTPVADANGVAPGDPGWIPTFEDNPMGSIALPAPGQSPRTITQLITSSDVDPDSPSYNPAAAAAMEALGGGPVEVSNSVVGSAQTGFLPNPGILGGVTYNEWFVAFGQFFDHGLDFISKGGGYVMIPLSPSDPLYDPDATGPTANMMMLSRGSISNPAEDFNADGTLKDGVVPLYNNNTGLMIDQSQTYGSHETINVLLRQYDGAGVVTGRLIDGSEDGTIHRMENGVLTALDVSGGAVATPDGGMADGKDELATWADMKANAARLGIELIDMDVLDAPSIKADAVGKLEFTPQQGFMFRSDQSIADIDAALSGSGGYASVAANDPFERDSAGAVLRSNQAILSDIAFGANPGGPVPYDPAALAIHKVSGDHRVNENIGLTAVHHVFHEEHNIQVQAIKEAVTEQAAALNDGSPEGLQAEADYLADWQTAPGVWDGEKIYQAARIITESEYNHIAIDQYMGGLYPALPEFVSYSADINLSVSLEFSQAVFRLGHSQLSETMRLAVQDANGINPGEPGYTPTYTSEGLFDVFLNPGAYDEYGASGIVLGLMNQQGNEMDEFVTAALQQSLVGVPLDLASLNIARGRDVGLPTLNELRQQMFDGLLQNTNNNANGSGLAPYSSWEDFGGHIRTAESLVNFIAAYGRENDVFHLQDMRVAYEQGGVNPATGAPTTLQDLRDNAQIILDAAADPGHALHDEAVMFMRGDGQPLYIPGSGAPNTPGYVPGHWDVTGGSGDQGFWDIDLWVGGLAEQPLFDGPLGTTFSFVLLDFAQRMQDGDRFYYLYRMPVGQHLGDQIIGEQFADLIQRTTGLEHTADAFSYQSAFYYLDGGADGVNDGLKSDVDADNSIHDYFNAIYVNLPDVVKPVVVSNSSFEIDSTASGDSGVVTEPVYGNYTSGAPTGWTLSGAGGVFAPTTAAIGTNGHAGGNVAWLAGGTTLAKNTDVKLVEGNSYTLSLKVGNRLNGGSWQSAQARLVDSTGMTLAALSLTDPGDGSWGEVTLSTGPISAGQDGLGLKIEIQNTGGSEQILVDNVSLTSTEPGGSANDGHIVVVGFEGDDFIVGALGDDVIYGDAGNDVIEGAQGNDHLYGGDGDDYITDYENDDFISGGAGNDYVSAGPGVLDTIHGNDGDDELHGGDGIDEVFGDDGDDLLYGEGDTDLMMGGEGNDYMDGGDSVDEMFGGNGNDWMRGGVGDDHMNGGSGNDLMEGGLGPVANDGDRYFGDNPAGLLPVIEWNGDGTEGDMDIVSYEDVKIPVYASLQTSNASGTSRNLLDTYAFDEGIVGSRYDDLLEGAGADAVASNGPNNYLIGGAGNDRLTGLGGDDFIFGDSVVVDSTLYWVGDARHTSGAATGQIENWRGTGETRVQFSDGLGHILGDNGDEGTADVAVFRGNRSDYTIETLLVNGEEVIRITDLRDPSTTFDATAGVDTFDGTDLLIGVEFAEFANGQQVALNGVPPTDIQWTAVVPAGNSIPGANKQIATLSAVDPDSSMWTYELLPTSSAGFGISAAGIVMTTSAMQQGQTYTLDVRVTDDIGGVFDETFTLKTGSNGVADILSGAATDDVLYGRNGADQLSGDAGNDTVFGQGGADRLEGGAGNDTVYGGRGNDTVVWNAGDGRDVIMGGANGGRGDAFVVNGDATAENYDIFTNAEAVAAFGYAGTAEIVVTRNGLSDQNVIAELKGIEEITVNSNGGGGAIGIHGDFTGTSLHYNTITINGDGDDDTVDISELTSDHRIVFHGGGGTDQVIGDLRPQDVVDHLMNGGGNSDEDDDGALGTAAADVMVGGGSADVLSGGGGGDLILGKGGDDTLLGGAGNDLIKGDAGSDVVFGGSGDDDLFGGAGQDLVFGDGGNDRIFADEGDDVIEGGAGDDTVYAGSGDDRVIAGKDDGDDVYWGGSGQDTLDYAAITASLQVDLGNGLLRHGSVESSHGDHDTIFGFENVIGGSGNDTVIASAAVNVMDGGLGSDSFVFRSAEDANGDTIAGFQPGDKIDLSGIDADADAAGHQSFVLFAGVGFTAAGQVTVTHQSGANGEHTLVAGDIDGDGNADFEIDVTGHHSLTANDFNGVG